MMIVLKILFAALFLVDKKLSVGKRLKMIYEKDISEHCRRRVVPSIFLGRQVIEANAKMLQFSRLELPYNCYISVRTEAGSSMVMVLQITTADLQESCNKGAQLLIYEMGETFGGYWGPWPDKVLNMEQQSVVPFKPYTLKTTPKSTTPTISTLKEEEEEEDEETEKTQISTASSKQSSEDPKGDYVEVEIPLVNVSVLSNIPLKGNQVSETVDTFDFEHDVTPIKGVAYESSILPLVQFRLVGQPGVRRSEEGAQPSNYDLELLQDFTPDVRLTLPQLNLPSKRRNKQRYYQSTRRLNFKKHRTLFHSQRQNDRRVMSESITRITNYVTKYSFPTTRNVTTIKPKHTQDSWRVIEEIIKHLNKTQLKVSKTTLSVKDVKLLEELSDMDHKKSAYLSSNLSLYVTNKHKIPANDAVLSTWNPVSLTTKEISTILNILEENGSTESVPKMQNEIKSTSTKAQKYQTQETLKSEISTTKRKNTEGMKNKQILTTAVSKVSVRTTRQDVFGQTNETQESSTESFVESRSQNNTPVTGSMVGHESWENLVQAAPEMAVLLNQTVAEFVTKSDASDVITKGVNQTPHEYKKLERKKRAIHSIDIENAKPHTVTPKKVKVTTTKQTFDVADLQEFAELVELQDDELHGRVALRHLHQYVGPPLFNLCQMTDDPTKPHVHLFNSSRIVLAANNFTLTRLVVILTAARALLSGESRCPKAMIECQVSGARVCLDSTVACDGVPNCGSLDIYDEDRLMCGHTINLQHNVYLAAFTFLAVLLTVIYAVHYWLKRCVPKVADAFFVYSDGVENVLYLDTIMHSPHDMADDENRVVYHGNLYDDIYDEDVTAHHKKSCLRFLKKICCCCRKSPKKLEETETSHMTLNVAPPKRMFSSFTELEIRKMGSPCKDTAVQTGDSLEMRPLINPKETKILSAGKHLLRPELESSNFPLKVTDSLLTLEVPLPENHTDELGLLQFLNAAARVRRNSVNSWSDSIESHSKKQPQSSPPDTRTLGSHTRFDSPSEKEIEIYTYRHSVLEPGPSKKNEEYKEQIPSSSRHLRFNEVTTEIPAEDDPASTSNDGRRTVALTDKGRRISRALDTIEEADEHTTPTKDHRNFWGLKKSKKKTLTNHR